MEEELKIEKVLPIVHTSFCFLAIARSQHTEEEFEKIIAFCKRENIDISVISEEIRSDYKKILRALQELNPDECKLYSIRHDVDYAWVWRVLQDEKFWGYQRYSSLYTSCPSFVKDLIESGFIRLKGNDGRELSQDELGNMSSDELKGKIKSIATNINTYKKYAVGKGSQWRGGVGEPINWIPWTFTDPSGHGMKETRRRNAIAQKFIEVMHEL